MFFEIGRQSIVTVSPLRLVLDLAMGFIYSLGELFSSVLMFIMIRMPDLDTVLIVIKNRGRGNGIERVGDDFTKALRLYSQFSQA